MTILYLVVSSSYNSKNSSMYKGLSSPLNIKETKSVSTHNHDSSRSHLYSYDNSNANTENGVNKHKILGPRPSQNPTFSPLSPNINKNPISPTAKVKMFSKAIHPNSKAPAVPSPHEVKTFSEDTTAKQRPKITSDLVDLGCDEVLDDLNLMCDQTLEEEYDNEQKGRRDRITKQGIENNRLNTNKLPLTPKSQNEFNKLNCFPQKQFKASQGNSQHPRNNRAQRQRNSSEKQRNLSQNQNSNRYDSSYSSQNSEKHDEKLRWVLSRTKNVIQGYRRQAQEEKLEIKRYQSKQEEYLKTIQFLERENVKLRKCLNIS